jgi:predicted TIM-barrel fold metal-dependent hydrolase
VTAAASVCDNIFMETSSTGSKSIAGYIKRCGAERVMFGSDAEHLLAEEMFRWRSLPIGDAQREQCLCRTAAAVFCLPVSA